jgi:signal transduction histidine kinase
VAETAGAVALAGVLPDGVALLSAEGLLQYVNPAFTRVFAAAEDALPAGTTVAELSEREPFRHADALWRGWADEPGRKYRCQLYGPHVVEGVWHRLGGDGGRAVVIADVTGDAQVRRRLRQHNRALAELVATKTELVSALLHELRTPLAAARSMAGLLPAAAGDPLLEEAARGIGRNLDRLDRVILQMATISGIENGTIDLAREPIDLAGLLQGLDTPPGLRRTVSVTGEAPVIGDRARLTEVFERLVGAVAAVNGESDPVGIVAREGDWQWRISLRLPANGAADQLFTSTGTRSNATALMLARAVVGRLGGTVGIETEQGRPCLMVRLPALSRGRSGPPPAAADPSA